jgi:hypothetical protein
MARVLASGSFSVGVVSETMRDSRRTRRRVAALRRERLIPSVSGRLSTTSTTALLVDEHGTLTEAGNRTSDELCGHGCLEWDGHGSSPDVTVGVGLPSTAWY